MSEPGLRGQPMEPWEELVERHAVAVASLTATVRALLETQADILDMIESLADELADVRQRLAHDDAARTPSGSEREGTDA